MDLRVTIIKISKSLFLLILFLVAYSLLIGLAEMAFAPFYGTASSGDNVTSGDAYAAVSDIAEDAPEPPEPAVQLPPTALSAAAQTQNDYITIQMKDTDIFKGSLILINSGNSYMIPEDNDLVSVADIKTSSYRVDDKEIMLDASIADALNEMMDAFFAETGRDSITAISGFRTYEKQQEILDDYINLLGPIEALKWAATPGNSEHHSGLALDIGVYNGTAVRTFTGMGVNAWFKENCYKYGFILRYTKDKTNITGTADEPWHFRYIGNPHATSVYRNAWCFEEYINHIRDFTFDDPCQTIYNSEMYLIYYTSDSNIRIPFDCEFDISGDNIGGFIVTVKPVG